MGSKKQGFWPRINCLHPVTVCQKLGVIINKVILKLKSARNAFYKKGAPKLIFSIIFFRNIRMIFDNLKIHFESPKLTLFDELSPDGDSKSVKFIFYFS